MNSTVLIEEHKKLKAQCAPFGEWLMPIQYSGIISEHNWTRRNCSIFDICHMGEFLIHGDAAASGLERVLTLGFRDFMPGSCRYGFILNERAGIIDDVILYRLEDEEWMLVVNSATAASDLAHLKNNLSSANVIEDISAKTAKIDVQGPLSREVLTGLAGDDLNKLSYYTFSRFSLLGEEVIISRTGYTGELGFEVYIDTGKAAGLWDELLKDERVRPAGLGARDTLRLEAGYPLYGHELNELTSPLEAGMMKFVDLDKDFIGRAALLERKNRSLDKKLCFFKTTSRRAPRAGYRIFKNDRPIGEVSSGSFSPSLSCGIGIGYIDPEFAGLGTDIVLKQDNIEITAVLTSRPFYKNTSLRA